VNDLLAWGRALRQGSQTAVELASRCLDRARATEGLGIFLHLDAEAVLDQARTADRELEQGWDRGALHGVAVAIKDNISTRGQPTTCASRLLEGFVPVYDAEVVRRLRAAGAVLFGKTNLDEFGMGSSCENSGFGPTRNPWDQERVPGGSSGGSAAALAAGVVPLALGTDTGGSVRQPAAFCGVVGLRPTWGAVSRKGLIAFSSSLDQIGPMAVDVAGCAALYEAMVGHDPGDATSAVPTRPTPLEAGGPLRVGVLKESRGPGVEGEVAAGFHRALHALAAAGAEVAEVALPSFEHAVATYYLIASAEASSNLARFDGVRYGRRARSDELLGMYEETRSTGFGSEVKRRIVLGTFALSAGYRDAYYGRATAMRARIAGEFATAFAAHDLLICPTAPSTAFALGSKLDDPWQMYLGDVFTIPPALAGVPAISVPCPGAGPLPVGVQLIAPRWCEQRLFEAAAIVEAAADRPARQVPEPPP
jgi:aspartyl-tRNA(Asn)/glutamyl-tRNA(Gln) amidotransferase subunit A